jgi:hypothetical protein
MKKMRIRPRTEERVDSNRVVGAGKLGLTTVCQ